ncbi:chemotaxis protein CheD [Clostridium sp. YIM B02515]|uniref:Probable chemoreceptor glutamine deamidase CheD n=1 Tax=Clostridium rhizosphaerae TaxID=2803861 RepID=A0ABS1TF69_9CLOT|nr:chemotaxis protein CheD [Clostridium rhizosphaerae]MBL4938023.1 chemotaxis protein CheD [Clostridium rhizosphaerae]
MDCKEIKVGIADLNIALSPDRLITVGLGSCIGIALFDKTRGIGGLAHIMLPDSKLFNAVNNPNKFADLAIPALIERMEKLGAIRRNIKAKIAGGASMFNFSDKSMMMDVGNRNSAAVKTVLQQLSIPIIGEDVGGNKGRTMIFDTLNGIVQIRTVGMGIKEL